MKAALAILLSIASQLQPPWPQAPMQGELVRVAVSNKSESRVKFLACPNPPQGEGWREIDVPPGFTGYLPLDSGRRYDLRMYWYRGEHVLDFGINNTDLTSLAGAVREHDRWRNVFQAGLALQHPLQRIAVRFAVDAGRGQRGIAYATGLA